MDMTGSGRSPYTFVEQSIQSLAGDVVDVLDALKVSKVVIVGHSMSGLTMPQVAAIWPDRVAAVVLLGPVFPSKEITPVFEGRIKSVDEGGMDAMAEVIPFNATGPNTKPLVHAMIRELLLATEPQAYISLCKVIASAWKTPPEYEKVECPVLIIAGDQDKAAPVEGCEKILKAMANCQEKELYVQKNIGHWMAVEVPEDCGEKIVSWFKQIQ